MFKSIIIALITFVAAGVFAQDLPTIDPESENLAGDYAQCAAYYRLVYFAMESSDENEAAMAYRELEDNAMFYSLLLASKSREQDVAVNVTNSRIEMNMNLMKEEADNRNENISVLINKYHFNCKELSENTPELVMQAIKDATQ